MKLYNTMTREKEEFCPLNPEKVGIYSCGPTVYQYAHIGNLRTYVFMDLLRRVIRLSGHSLLHVMNITDVGHLTSDADEGEDKMEKSAREQKKSPWDIAAYYTGVFLQDIDRLNIERPELIPKATDHIAEMISFVEGLIQKGYAYETSDGIYYDISKFKGYGKLSGQDPEELLAGARVEVNEEKRNPADFALWKKAPKEHIMQWASPWGQGYPGWHIECSAMGLKYLGNEFDIHTGGVDHIPIHHENEIAQAEGYLGHSPARMWVHGEFMLVNGGKMSKSLKNTYTLTELIERGFSPLDFRYFCLNAHYRSKLNFTFDGLKAAKTAYERLRAAVKSHESRADTLKEGTAEKFRAEFLEAVTDDLNAPKGLGILWNLARNPEKSDELYRLALEFDAVLGLDLDRAAEENLEDIAPEVEALIEKRQQARKERDFKEADRIRDELSAMGIELRDTTEGVTWKRRAE